MKPRICSYPTKHGMFWTCSGEDRIGIGRTPDKAYWNWLGMKYYIDTMKDVLLNTLLSDNETRH